LCIDAIGSCGSLPPSRDFDSHADLKARLPAQSIAPDDRPAGSTQPAWVRRRAAGRRLQVGPKAGRLLASSAKGALAPERSAA
jgi:hypothetical protein